MRGKESPFLRELIEDEVVEVLGDNRSKPSVCPGCRHGILVVRRGPYGEFHGCSTFPRCRHTQKVSV